MLTTYILELHGILSSCSIFCLFIGNGFSLFDRIKIVLSVKMEENLENSS